MSLALQRLPLQQPAIRPAPNAATVAPPGARFHDLYRRLAQHTPDQSDIDDGSDFLKAEIAASAHLEDGLPANPEDLYQWVQGHAQSVQSRYQSYLDGRKAGTARRFFHSRAHALYFIRQVAPTKLVDGAWLYGICRHAGNPLFHDLLVTYLEELGDGVAAKNHVTLYRALLARYGLGAVDDLPDALYRQGAIQAALGWNAEVFLPEVIGFNLGYEQLPLHLLITAYELNELGIDPYYFTLHVTIDNADSGHARRACQAAWDAAPKIGDARAYWDRVRAGARLSNAGTGTQAVIDSFDIGQEVIRIFARKAGAGRGAHSDFCKLQGRTVNDWLATPECMADFLAALEKAGWVKRGEPVQESRFWRLLQGPRAEMFGVFSPYELQVIHDWIRGAASADGAAYDSNALPGESLRPRTFRVTERLNTARAGSPVPQEDDDLLDLDLLAFNATWPHLDAAGQNDLLVRLMAPALHWSPAGLAATRLFATRAGTKH